MTTPSEAARRRAAEEIVSNCGHVPGFDDWSIQNLEPPITTDVACVSCIDAALTRAVAEEQERCANAIRTLAPAK